MHVLSKTVFFNAKVKFAHYNRGLYCADAHLVKPNWALEVVLDQQHHSSKLKIIEGVVLSFFVQL